MRGTWWPPARHPRIRDLICAQILMFAQVCNPLQHRVSPHVWSLCLLSIIECSPCLVCSQQTAIDITHIFLDLTSHRMVHKFTFKTHGLHRWQSAFWRYRKFGIGVSCWPHCFVSAVTRKWGRICHLNGDRHQQWLQIILCAELNGNSNVSCF